MGDAAKEEAIEAMSLGIASAIEFVVQGSGREVVRAVVDAVVVDAVVEEGTSTAVVGSANISCVIRETEFFLL